MFEAIGGVKKDGMVGSSGVGVMEQAIMGEILQCVVMSRSHIVISELGAEVVQRCCRTATILNLQLAVRPTQESYS